MKKLGSVIIPGLGFLLCFGGPARAQWEGMGEAVKKGASDAAKEELMKGAAEKLGLPTPSVTAAPPTPTAPEAAAATATPAAEEPKATPTAGDAPAGEPGAGTGAPDAPAGEAEAAPEAAGAPAGAAAEDMEKMIKEKALEEGGKKMMPKMP